MYACVAFVFVCVWGGVRVHVFVHCVCVHSRVCACGCTKWPGPGTLLQKFARCVFCLARAKGDTLRRPPSPQKAVILVLFNTADSLSYSEVRDLSGMGADEKELRRNLMSLCVGKV